MKIVKTPAVFETQNVDLATYLMFEGIDLLECTRSTINDKVIVMRFEDKHGKCLDLERLFLNSDFKKYREYQKYLLQLIHKTLRN